ncbi:MAG: SPOR domain-containing protein [Rhizomicrobium sp.]
MANLERGAHDADNVYAFDPNEEDDAAVETSRLPLLIAIALVVLAAFAGVVWLAYTQGVEEGRADAPRIAAAPARRAPATPAANPYAGLNIYQPPASSDAGNEPIAPIPSGHNAAADTSQPPLRPSASAAAEKPPTAQIAQTPAKPAPLRARPSPKAAAQAKALTPAPLAASVAPAAQIPAAPGPEGARPVATAAAASPETPAAGAMVQIGSYKSDAEARESWNAFKARHAIAAAFGHDVKEVDLGGKGVWYRLRIGAFQDRRAAAAFCEKLKALSASCIVSR